MKSNKKIPKVFIGFLFLSALFWVIITFSKTYKATLNFPVTYTNLSQDKLLKENTNETIKLNIRSTGFKILRAKIFGKKIAINASQLRKKNNAFYVLLTSQKNAIEKQLFSGTELLSFFKDTLFLNIGQLSSKKVKLVADVNLKYHIGYDLLNDIVITPDSITISGPNSLLDTISQLKLASLNLDDVKDDIKKELSVIVPNGLEKIKLEAYRATVTGDVEKFTEGTLDVQFNIVNKPQNIIVNTLSETVQVSYIVALSKFDDVDENSFSVECNFGLSNKKELSYLIPKITQKPDFIKSVKLNPQKIDFLIVK